MAVFSSFTGLNRMPSQIFIFILTLLSNAKSGFIWEETSVLTEFKSAIAPFNSTTGNASIVLNIPVSLFWKPLISLIVVAGIIFAAGLPIIAAFKILALL